MTRKRYEHYRIVPRFEAEKQGNQQNGEGVRRCARRLGGRQGLLAKAGSSSSRTRVGFLKTVTETPVSSGPCLRCPLRDDGPLTSASISSTRSLRTSTIISSSPFSIAASKRF